MFKYGEWLYHIIYWRNRRPIYYRFRKDSVPYKGKLNFFCGYKIPKMRKRELSLYTEHKKFVRARRNPKYMPDPWDDVPRSDYRNCKSWKTKKIQKQWMKNL